MTENNVVDIKTDKTVTQVFSYEVVMLVHIVADTQEQAKTQLDEKGGIVTKREVKLLNSVVLYGEKETE
jgi:hypothetical protein